MRNNFQTASAAAGGRLKCGAQDERNRKPHAKIELRDIPHAAAQTRAALTALLARDEAALAGCISRYGTVADYLRMFDESAAGAALSAPPAEELQRLELTPLYADTALGEQIGYEFGVDLRLANGQASDVLVVFYLYTGGGVEIANIFVP